MTSEDLRLWLVKEVADMWRVSTMTVYRLIRAGDVKALRVGKNFRIPEAEVLRYMKQHKVDG